MSCPISVQCVISQKYSAVCVSIVFGRYDDLFCCCNTDSRRFLDSPHQVNNNKNRPQRMVCCRHHGGVRLIYYGMIYRHKEKSVRWCCRAQQPSLINVIMNGIINCWIIPGKLVAYVLKLKKKHVCWSIEVQWGRHEFYGIFRKRNNN